jgi:hypothetical protein
MQSSGAARQRDGVRDADNGRELTLEGVDMRPKRCDPVGVERLEKEPSFLSSHIGRRQEDSLCHLRPTGFAGTPTTVVLGSTERVTHAPAPMTAPSPIVSGSDWLPLMMTAPVPT